MNDSVRIGHEELERFMRTLLERAGVAQNEAVHIAEAMAWCDLVGRHTQGLWRLPTLLRRLDGGALRSPCGARVERTGDSTARIEGGAGFGYHLAHLGMTEAIALARESGVGAVGISGSDHFGAGAFYGSLATRAGMIGLATSNAFPKVAAYGGRTPVLGTNPFSVAFPSAGDPVLIDFSTSPISGAAVRRAAADGSDVESHLVAGDDRPSPVLRADGPKGFALGLMVEILSGVLTGAGLKSELRSTVSDTAQPAGLGQFLLAIDPARFVGKDEFERRLQSLIDTVRASLPLVDGQEVRIPGDARHRARRGSSGAGIGFRLEELEDVTELANRLGASPPW